MKGPRGTCARCGRSGLHLNKTFPDGKVCGTCHSRAVRTTGACAVCARQRLLVGRVNATAVCTDCAGIARSYLCSRCGAEWELVKGQCERCELTDVLAELCDGEVDLEPLTERLLAAPRPDHIIIWLYGERPRRLLNDLSNGRVPLTHEALDAHPRRHAADHLRDLLVDVGLLPGRDRVLANFDRWVHQQLSTYADSDSDLAALHRFARWHLRRRLADSAAKAPLTAAQGTLAAQELRIAAAFLSWLRCRGRELSACTQSDLDTWWNTPPTTNTRLGAFVVWSIKTRLCPKLTVPQRRNGTRTVLSQHERLTLLKTMLDPATGALAYRVAGMLLLLLAQPFSRVARLRVDDLSNDPDGATLLRLSDVHSTPVPEPFAGMLRELAASRANLNTAAHHESPWLFPGRAAGQPIRDHTLHVHALAMGINILGARNAALRQLASDVPPSVVADALGYSAQTADRHAAEAGSPWASYAALRQRPTNPR